MAAGVVPLLASENRQEQKFVMTMEIDVLKKQIADFIEMERRSCSMDVITPLYVSRMLNVPLEEVSQVMRSLEMK